MLKTNNSCLSQITDSMEDAKCQTELTSVKDCYWGCTNALADAKKRTDPRYVVCTLGTKVKVILEGTGSVQSAEKITVVNTARARCSRCNLLM